MSERKRESKRESERERGRGRKRSKNDQSVIKNTSMHPQKKLVM